MGFFKKNYEAQNVSQQQQLQSKYQSARANLLLVIAFSVINVALLVAQSNTYFLFSAFIPYFLTDLGMLFCGMYPAEYYADLGAIEFFDKSVLAVFIAISAIVILMYLLSWIFSKKNRVGWLIFALVFFSIDTLAMFALSGFALDSIIDILFHIWVIFYLANGINAHYKLKKLPPEEEVLPPTQEVILNGTPSTEEPSISPEMTETISANNQTDSEA